LGRDRGDDWRDFRGPQREDTLAVKKTLGFKGGKIQKKECSGLIFSMFPLKFKFFFRQKIEVKIFESKIIKKSFTDLPRWPGAFVRLPRAPEDVVYPSLKMAAPQW